MSAKMEGLAHVGLFIKDVERTVKFYTEILDFEVIERTEVEGSKVAFVQNGNLVIEVVQPAVYQQRGDGLFDHIALKVKNIEEIKDRLEKKGIEFEEKEIYHAPQVFPDGSKWILFRGPDNEHLELNEKL
jgi:lactoylglutathione lyase